MTNSTLPATTYLRTKRREMAAKRVKLTFALVTVGIGVIAYWIARE